MRPDQLAERNGLFSSGKIRGGILIGRRGKNAEVKTAQNKKDYAVLSIATSESWKSDKGEYKTRTEWQRVGQKGAESGDAPTPEHHDRHPTTWHRPNSAIAGTNLLK
jgi:hypothetical protein